MIIGALVVAGCAGFVVVPTTTTKVRKSTAERVSEDMLLPPLEPPSYEENRVKARERKAKAEYDEKGERRRALFAAQQEFRRRARRKPGYLKMERKLDDVKEGEWFDGKVRKFRPYGAYVSIGTEIDGFLHIKDITDEKFLESPEEALRLGQSIRVGVKYVDPQKQILALTANQHTFQRGDLELENLPVKFEHAKITKTTPYAAYVDVGAVVPAYLHVADIGLLPQMKIGAPRVPRVTFEPGFVIPECWVKSVDLQRKRIRITTVPPDEQAEHYALREAHKLYNQFGINYNDGSYELPENEDDDFLIRDDPDDDFHRDDRTFFQEEKDDLLQEDEDVLEDDLGADLLDDDDDDDAFLADDDDNDDVASSTTTSQEP